MSPKDVYNSATIYNPVDVRTQAPQHNDSSNRSSSSRHMAPSSSRPSSSNVPNTYTTLERDNQSSIRPSSSRHLQQHSTLQRDGQGFSPHRHTSANQNTLLYRDQQSFSSLRQPSLIRASATSAPPDARSRFKTQHDVDMASKQVRYQEMNHEEKKKQDQWVSDFIKYAGPCPAGFSWERVREGYVCNGGNHFCTDEVLAEGKGGFYFGTLAMGWWGPIYDFMELLDYAEAKVWDHARKHGLDPSIAPVMPNPDLPATGEIHPGIAKAKAGLGPMPQQCSDERVRQPFELVGLRDRNGGGMSLLWPNTQYGSGGLSNRLAISTSNGSAQSNLAQALQLQQMYGLPSYSNSTHGSGNYGHGSYGQGTQGRRRY
ncbi:hypothetical protein MFRU_024g00580 [Monilinia fructicola]|uniref:Uncharacterized protein n=1 Tax=Monilinia fructicola TaxID=38448 RepID=A0A5M9J6D7_MONFR|nr:hypothetical protein EYC84_011771 [Monilinia fructicola]KAG4028088.1 hypothetical protein MFRU_024g00580 [Monilinia fructicola]